MEQERKKRVLRYEIARPHQLPAIHKLMYQSFNKDEPMTRHLGLYQGAFSIPDIDAMVEALVMDHNLSIIAFDAETNIPLGVMLNGVFHKEELEVIESCEDSKFVPIASMLHEVQIRSKDYFLHNDIQSTFDLKMVSTSPESRGQGIATDLILRSVQLAKCLGYSFCKTEATGDYSRKAFLKAGFQIVTECKYADYSYDGRKVFEGIKDHQGTALMIKKL